MKTISNIEEWQEILNQSANEPVTILKHSSTCGVSGSAYSRVADGVEKGVITGPVYVVIVQESRELSNRIAAELNVVHQSPQVIVIRNKTGVYQATHFGIDSEEISSQISSNK